MAAGECTENSKPFCSTNPSQKGRDPQTHPTEFRPLGAFGSRASKPDGEAGNSACGIGPPIYNIDNNHKDLASGTASANRVPVSMKILVVEDHKDSCLWISAVLRQSGFTPIEAEDGTLAVRLARSEKPDLVLLDLHLPCGGGEFVLESLQKQPVIS